MIRVMITEMSDHLTRQLKWDCYFLSMCLLNTTMSLDPSTQVGAVVVGPDLEVRSTGFNGFPRHIHDTEDRLSNRETKLKLMVHAEMNACLAAARIGVSVKGCTLYLVATNKTGGIWGGPPCTRCTVEMIQAGITEVVSVPFKDAPSRWLDDLSFSMKLLDEAGILYREVPEFQLIPGIHHD